MIGAVRDWLTPAGDPWALGRWRAWAGAVATIYLLVRAPAVLDAGGTWRPVGVLRLLDAPLDATALRSLLVVSILGCVALTVGWAHRVTGPVAAVATLLVLTHRSSTGQILWFDVLMVLHLLVLAAAPATVAFSLDARRRHVESFDPHTVGWALRLGGLVTVVTYVVAGVAKLRIGGASWITDGALERHIAYSATRLEVLGASASPLAKPLLDLGIASVPLSLAVVALELGAPLALLGRRWALGWAIAVWVMHLAIALTMFVVFHWPLLGAAFVPLILSVRASAREREGRTPRRPRLS